MRTRPQTIGVAFNGMSHIPLSEIPVPREL
jgi:hypothetical protein